MGTLLEFFGKTDGDVWKLVTLKSNYDLQKEVSFLLRRKSYSVVRTSLIISWIYKKSKIGVVGVRQ